MYLRTDLAYIYKTIIDEDQRFAGKSEFFKPISKVWNKIQWVLIEDKGNISSESIYAHNSKLPDETKSNKIENVKQDAFDVILDRIKFSRGVSEVLTIARDIDQKL